MSPSIQDSANVSLHTGSTNASFQTVSSSLAQYQLVTLVNHVFLCGLIGLFGIISNIINMIVFYKQGLDSTINISFFAIAGSDLWSLIFQMWYIMYDIPYFQELNLPMVYADVHFLIGAVPRELFARITCLITAYVTAERCLCIAFPLHVKQMITPKRTTMIIIIIFIISWSYMLPIYVVGYLDWQFNGALNKTILGGVVTEHKELVDGIVYITHAISGVVSLVAVIVLTLILTRKLGQSSAWRKSVKIDKDKSDVTSKRDRATMTMVVLIAGLLIVCYLPSVAISVVTFCEPDFSMTGRFNHLYIISWSFALLFETINSSFNIFFYYKMSTKFRQIFRKIFTKCGQED